MSSIQDLFNFALERMPDAVHIRVKQGDEEIEVTSLSDGGHNAVQPAKSKPDIVSGAALPHVPVAAQTTALRDNSFEFVTAPLVGIFYTAPAPDAEPFVTVGQSVKKGDTLCIIEAMKLLNEIEAQCDGVIESVLVENGTMVEYNQPLFQMRA